MCGGGTSYYTQPAWRSSTWSEIAFIHVCFVRQHARMHSHAHMCRRADDEGYLAATASRHDTRVRKPFQPVVCVHKTHAHLHAVFIQPGHAAFESCGPDRCTMAPYVRLCRRRLLGKRFKFKRVNGLSGRPLIHERTRGSSICQPVVASFLCHLSSVVRSVYVCYVIPEQCIQQLLLNLI